jgi:hypothetical protein
MLTYAGCEKSTTDETKKDCKLCCSTCISKPPISFMLPEYACPYDKEFDGTRSPAGVRNEYSPDMEIRGSVSFSVSVYVSVSVSVCMYIYVYIYNIIYTLTLSHTHRSTLPVDKAQTAGDAYYLGDPLERPVLGVMSDDNLYSKLYPYSIRMFAGK